MKTFVSLNITENITNEWPFGTFPETTVIRRNYMLLIFLLLICVFGAFGNSLLILTLIRTKHLQIPRNVYIGNLAVADLLVCGFHMPLESVNLAFQQNFFGDNVCKSMAFVVIVSCSCSVFSMLAIALKRYMFTCKREMHRLVFHRHWVIAHITIIWIVSLGLGAGPFLGWGEYKYYESVHGCSFDHDKPSFTAFAVGSIGIAISVCMGIYSVLFLHYKRLRHTAHLRQQRFGAKNIPQIRLDRTELHVTIQLFVVALVFAVFWSPYVLVIILHLLDSPAPPTWLVIVVGWLGMCNSCVNFVVYGLADRRIRRAYNRFFSFL